MDAESSSSEDDEEDTSSASSAAGDKKAAKQKKKDGQMLAEIAKKQPTQKLKQPCNDLDKLIWMAESVNSWLQQGLLATQIFWQRTLIAI